MTVFLIACSIALLLWVAILRRSLSRLRAKLKMQEEKHRQEYADFIAKVNHEGQVPIASTALGLTRLISLAIGRCLKWLEDLRNNKDWNTLSVSDELSGVRSVEMVMLDKKLKDLVQAIRDVLEENNHRQE